MQHFDFTATTPHTIPEANSDLSPAVVGAGLLGVAICAYITFVMPTGNSWGHLGRFLTALGGLSVLCFWIWRKLATRGANRRSISLVLGFAVLFRMLLLPAGLTGSDPAAALQRDLSGDRVGYGSYNQKLWMGELSCAAYPPSRTRHGRGDGRGKGGTIRC